MVLLVSAATTLMARHLAGASALVRHIVGAVAPALPVLAFLLSRVAIVGPVLAYYNPEDFYLTVTLVVSSLCGHGMGFLLLNDLLASESMYLRTLGRVYVVLISVSLACSIVLPFLVMTFGR